MSGWYRESHRHYLAAKGIRTSQFSTRYNAAKTLDTLRAELLRRMSDDEEYALRRDRLLSVFGDDEEVVDRLLELEDEGYDQTEAFSLLREEGYFASKADTEKKLALWRRLHPGLVKKQFRGESPRLTAEYARYRQADPKLFVKGSFRTKMLGDKKMVFGKEKSSGKYKLQSVFVKKEKDVLKGGLSDGLPAKAFDARQVRRGMKVESEHTPNPRLQKEISQDHLVEDPRYYEKLMKARL
jgi:hypothetical protein